MIFNDNLLSETIQFARSKAKPLIKDSTLRMSEPLQRALKITTVCQKYKSHQKSIGGRVYKGSEFRDIIREIYRYLMDINKKRYLNKKDYPNVNDYNVPRWLFDESQSKMNSFENINYDLDDKYNDMMDQKYDDYGNYDDKYEIDNSFNGNNNNKNNSINNMSESPSVGIINSDVIIKNENLFKSKDEHTFIPH